MTRGHCHVADDCWIGRRCDQLSCKGIKQLRVLCRTARNSSRLMGVFTIRSVLSLSCRRVASCPSRHARVRRCPAGSDTLAAELLRRRHVICRCRALLRLGWRRHRAACAFGAAATRADTRLPFFAKGAVASCYDGRGPSQAFTMHLRIETACAAGLCGPA